MKRICLGLLMAVAAVTCSAQKTTNVVHLKNGDILRGTIVEMIPEQNTRIRTLEGSSVTFPTSQMELVTSEASPLASNGLKRGYVGMCEASMGACIDEEQTSLALTSVHGFQFNPHIFLGGGVMVDIPDSMFPVFAVARFLMNRRFAPMADIRIGYDISNNGIYCSPSLGVRMQVGKQRRFALTPAFTINSVSDGIDDGHYNVGLRLGFEW